MLIKIKRIQVNIRVAFDTILYAPVYTFVHRNSRRLRSEFNYHIIPVRSPIETAGASELSALAPIVKDPTFSSVIQKAYFRANGHEHDWFGIGDPLRVRRLIQLRGDDHQFSFDFIGTLIDKLAFWVVTEPHCTFAEEKLWRFNYVACQSIGMTGYYLTESLFKTEGNNPIAPTRMPGQEVEHIFKMYENEKTRRSNLSGASDNDPVWLAAVSTEIDKILYFRGKYDSHGVPFYVGSIIQAFQRNTRRKLEREYLFTAIVARRNERDPDEQKTIERAKRDLWEGINHEIKRIKSDDPKERKSFIKDLCEFYWSRSSFIPPYASELKNLEHDLRDVIDEIKDLYATNMIASYKARIETNNLLKRAIESELQRNGNGDVMHKVTQHYNNLQTDTWQATHNQLWRSH